MYGNGILVRDDGKFEVFVHIQDGTENCGVYDTEDQAREAWAEAQETLNGSRRDPSEVSLYQQQMVSEKRLVCIDNNLCPSGEEAAEGERDEV